MINCMIINIDINMNQHVNNININNILMNVLNMCLRDDCVLLAKQHWIWLELIKHDQH